MIPTQTFEEFPEFSNTGAKVKPDDAKYAAGFVPSDVLPAQWLNWLMNKASGGVTRLNSGVKSIEEELNNVVSDTGATPAVGTKNQVLTAIKSIIGTFTGTLANLTTTAKSNLVAAINELKANITDNTTAIGANSTAIAENTAAINSINTFMLPVGTILEYGGETAPEGFLMCDGHEESRSAKSALFDVIGIKYGSGDGTTTFNVPDRRDRVAQGASEKNPVGTKLEAGLPNLNGIALFNIGANQTVGTGALKKSKVVNTASGFIGSTAGAMTVPQIEIDASDSSTIYKNNFNTVQPPAECSNFIIKY